LEEIPEELVEWQRVDSGPSAPPPAVSRVATRPGGRSPGNRPIISLHAGDRVTHDRYGMGTVVATEGAAEKSSATVDFGDEGVKRLLLRYAPVEKL
jgi:DNA helicase-2/ATP-dependent DNA helicase PcrA